MRAFISGLSVSLILSSCSFKKALDQTQETTSQMRDSTKRIENDSDHLVDGYDVLASDMTYDRSYFAMRENMAWLWGEAPANVEESNTGMILDGGATIKSMWFQFWRGKTPEEISQLDERLALGAEILLAQVMGHSPFDHPVENVFHPDRQFLGCASLAAKLEFVRPEFTRALKKAGLDPNFTFYDLIVRALQVRAEFKMPDPFPLATAKVLEFEQNAIYLLQLRHNYLPMMVLSSITNFKDLYDFEKLLTATGTRRVDIHGFGYRELLAWTQWLQMAKETRLKLRQMGIEPVYNSWFQRYLKSVDFGQTRWAVESTGTLDPMGKARKDFAQSYLEAVTP